MSTAPESSLVCKFSLRFAGQVLDASMRVPTRPITTTEMLPALYALTDALIGVAVEQVESQGPRVSCAAGCGACCRQAVPISSDEARHIAAVVDSLEPSRRATIEQRFEHNLARLDASGLGPTARDLAHVGALHQSTEFGLAYLRLGCDCPFLEEGSCSIHPRRPAACREYLVTSPPAHCADPGPGRIDMVDLPARPSHLLYSFADGEGDAEPRPLLLATALEWVRAHPTPAEPRLSGPRLLENFVRRLCGPRR